MNEIFIALFDIALFIFVAEMIKSIFDKFNLPYIVGEIVAGMLVGPYSLGLLVNNIIGFPVIAITDYIVFMSEFSIILLIFASGLEHGLTPIRSSGVYGVLGAIFGALLPFLVSYLIYLPRFGTNSSLLIGVAMGATSLAAVASVIEEMRLKGRSVNYIFSASTADDVVDLILLSVVLVVIGGNTLSVESVTLRIIQLVLILIVVFVIAVILVPRVANKLSEKYVEEFPFVVLFGLTLIMVYLGFSPIISAFIAGVSLSTSVKSEKIREISAVLLSVFGSIFFVTVGAETNLETLNLDVIVLSAELTVIAFVFKFLGVFPFAFAYSRDLRQATLIGVGMVPRGETGLVVASIGQSINTLSSTEFEGIVIMSLLTTLIGSILFRYLSHKWASHLI